MTAFTPIKSLPLNANIAEAKALITGQTSQLRRHDDALFRRVGPGDLFWLREPHHFFARHDALAPTTIARIYPHAPGIHFAADGPAPPSFGKLRSGRVLLRILSRVSLKILEVREQKLWDWSAHDANALGLTRCQYARAWNRNRQQLRNFGNNAQANWDDNPTVTVIDVEPVMINIDQLLAKKAA